MEPFWLLLGQYLPSPQREGDDKDEKSIQIISFLKTETKPCRQNKRWTQSPKCEPKAGHAELIRKDLEGSALREAALGDYGRKNRVRGVVLALEPANRNFGAQSLSSRSCLQQRGSVSIRLKKTQQPRDATQEPQAAFRRQNQLQWEIAIRALLSLLPRTPGSETQWHCCLSPAPNPSGSLTSPVDRTWPPDCYHL